MAKDLSNEFKIWRGKRRMKEVAALLNVPVKTYESWEYGLRSPSELALVEVRRRMNEHRIKTSV